MMNFDELNERKWQIRNLGGRHLGTYLAVDQWGAFEAMCREAGYATGADGEKARFASFERCSFRDATNDADAN